MKNLIWITSILMMLVCSCNKNDNQSEGNDTQYYYSDDICECSNRPTTQVLNNDTLWIPSGITPNGDLINDRFLISGIEAIPENLMKFMDRDNNVLIQFSPFNSFWDGTYDMNGTTVTAESGKYFFELTAGSQTIKGAILLISSIDPESDPYFDVKPSEDDCSIIPGLVDPDDPIFLWK